MLTRFPLFVVLAGPALLLFRKWLSRRTACAHTPGSERVGYIAGVRQPAGRAALAFLVVVAAQFFSTAPVRAQVTVPTDPNFTPSLLRSGLSSPDGVVFRASTGDLLVTQGSGQISIMNASTGALKSFATQAGADKVSVRASDGLVAVITAPFGPIDFYNSGGTFLGSIDKSTITNVTTFTTGDTVCLTGSVFDTSGNLFLAAGPGSTQGDGCLPGNQWGIYEFAVTTPTSSPWTATPTLVTTFGPNSNVVIQDVAYSAARPPLGTLYAIDSNGANVYEISLTPECEGLCGPTTIANVPAENPRGIAVDPLLGDIYVTDFDGNDVYRIPAPGAPSDPSPTVFATGFTSSLRLDFDTTGNLYVNGTTGSETSTTQGTWKFTRASNATTLQAVTQGQTNFLKFVNPNPTMTDQTQNIMIPSSANLGGTAFIQDIFVSVDPTTLDDTLANGTTGDTAYFGGAPVPAGTTCVPVPSASNNCVVVIQKCYDAKHNPFAICPVQEPSTTTDRIQLTFHYAGTQPLNSAFLIGFDDGDGQDITDITISPFNSDPTGSGGTKSLCSKTFAATLGTNTTNQDFSLSISSNLLDLTVPGPVSATVDVTAINGFASPVALGVSDALAGISATFNPTSVTPTRTSTVSVQLTGNATLGGMTALVANLLQAGCLDNSGIANALSSKLSAAQADINAGQIKTAINVLTAFNDLVKAQTGKHIATTCTTTFPLLVTGTAGSEVRATTANIKFAPVTLLTTDIQTILTSLKASVSSEDPITGFVVDSGGVGVQGATVTIMSGTTVVATASPTDATGFYYVATTSTLTVGQSYTIQVTLPFGTFTTATPPSSTFTWMGKGLAFNFTLN